MKPLPLFLAILVAFLIGWITSPLAWRKAPETPEIQRDTITVRDTTYLTKDSLIYVERFHNTTDTVTLYDIHHDTVTVEVPIEHKHEHYSDADVWYHGFRAGIDSLAVYPITTTITVTEREKRRPTKFGLGVQAGYGVTKEGGPVPYVGLGISWNPIRF